MNERYYYYLKYFSIYSCIVNALIIIGLIIVYLIYPNIKAPYLDALFLNVVSFVVHYCSYKNTIVILNTYTFDSENSEYENSDEQMNYIVSEPVINDVYSVV